MPSDPRAAEEQQTQQKAVLLKAKYVDTRSLSGTTTPQTFLKPEDMQKFGVVPLNSSSYGLEIGFTDATKKSSLDLLKQQFPQYNLTFSLISRSGQAEVMDAYFRQANKPNPEAAKMLSVQDQVEQARQQDLFLRIAQQAYSQSASDIHMEPSNTEVIVRYRIDGVLHPVASLAPERFQVLLTELQTKAGIKWNVDYPQTGRISAELEGKEGQPVIVDMRIETVPTLHGSDVVIRIFNLEVAYLELKNLGLSDAQKRNITELIEHPHGMVLIVGPTGSGKTSTQYSIINKLNKNDVKIVTLEDPIEYELTGVAQIPVRTIEKESFLEKFRAVLREDPDIIMLGEIRDADTAKTALQAAMTGHLVLSTFHASDSASAISRLMDMIGQNPLLASSVKLIMAQRLVRKLCDDCKQAYTPDEKEIEEIKSALENLPNESRSILEDPKLYRANSCNKCNHIGYRGRIMVAEQLKMSPEMEQFIAQGTAATTTDKIKGLAISQGMLSLYQDALLKVLQGLTSLEEVHRVIETN